MLSSAWLLLIWPKLNLQLQLHSKQSNKFHSTWVNLLRELLPQLHLEFIISSRKPIPLILLTHSRILLIIIYGIKVANTRLLANRFLLDLRLIHQMPTLDHLLRATLVSLIQLTQTLNHLNGYQMVKLAISTMQESTMPIMLLLTTLIMQELMQTSIKELSITIWTMALQTKSIATSTTTLPIRLIQLTTRLTITSSTITNNHWTRSTTTWKLHGLPPPLPMQWTQIHLLLTPSTTKSHSVSNPKAASKALPPLITSAIIWVMQPPTRSIRPLPPSTLRSHLPRSTRHPTSPKKQSSNLWVSSSEHSEWV